VELGRQNSRSHCVENSLWRSPRKSLKADHRMMKSLNLIYLTSQDHIPTPSNRKIQLLNKNKLTNTLQHDKCLLEYIGYMCYVWSIALYGAETWTLLATDQKHLESFEMWRWRIMEKIS